MAGTYVKKSGAWKSVNTTRTTPAYTWQRVGGLYKPMKGMYYKVAGVWKEVYLEAPDNYLPTNTNAVLGTNSTVLTWTAPVSSTVAKVHIRRGFNTKPLTVTDGTLVTEVARTVVTHTDTATGSITSPIGTYWFAWFTQLSGESTWRGPVYDSVEVSDVTAPAKPTVSVSNAYAGKARITFKNPSDSDFSYTEVRYSTSAYPSITSGTYVGRYSTAGQTHTINLQGPGAMKSVSYHNGEASGNYWTRTSNSYYYFSLFSVDLRGNTQTAAQTSVYFLRSPISVARTGNDSWGSTYGWESSDRIRQSNYGSSNRYRGYWYYATRSWTEIGGRQATAFTNMYRTTSSNGNNVNVPLKMYGHSYTSSAGGTGLGTYYGDMSGPGITFDNPRYCILPSGLTNAMKANSVYGMACYDTTDAGTYIGGDDYGSNDGYIDMYHYDYA